jgi:hypothetical protein
MGEIEQYPQEWADFYVGMPGEAEYLGSTSDGHPGALDLWADFQSLGQDEFGEADYRARVLELVDFTYWPHGYADSTETTWSYCWSKGTLYVYHQGVEMAQLRSNLNKEQPQRTVQGSAITVNRDIMEFRPRPAARFPAMTR